MLEPEQMPGLVDDGQPGVVADDRVVVPVAGIVEPGVAAFGRDRRIVAPGRARHDSIRRSASVALCVEVSVICVKVTLATCRIHIEDRRGRRLLDGGEGLEAVVLLAASRKRRR